jgi:pimeloyl-ACP methyl ester carboxylesterase
MTDVRFFGDGYTIAGTYTEVPSPVAAALVITGSGRINRDSDALLRRTGLPLLRSDFTRTQHKRLARLKASSGDVIRMQGIRVNARWFREFLGYDPAADYARITVPVLAVTGGHDMQVPPGDVDAIGRLVRGPFEGHVVDDLSHLLRPDPRWAGPRGYRRAVRQPVSPTVLSIITAWVTGRWSGGGPDSDRGFEERGVLQ